MYLNKKQALTKAGVIIGIFILANIIFDTYISDWTLLLIKDILLVKLQKQF